MRKSSTFVHGISRSRLRPHRARVSGGAERRRGTALVGSLVVFVAVAGLVLASTQISSVEIEASKRSIADVRATALAEAGVERSKALLVDAAKKTSIHDPLTGVHALFSGGSDRQTFTTEPMMAGGVSVGEYTTSMTLVASTSENVVVRITSTGYVPAAPANLGPKEELEAWDSIAVTVEYSLAPSEVFDYAYFVNNWGWLYASSVVVRGNARSNGQMDFGGYAPTVEGGPIYDSVDQSSDPVQVGERLSDGAVFSSWDVVNAQNGQGMAADSDNIFDFEDPIEMPNLTDLTAYENRALTHGASISIGGTVVADAVVGDGASESENLYLHGTFADPIVLDGPVVVRGDVVLSGYVTGQGTIYSGGNVYVPDSIEYLHGPSTVRPLTNSDANTEAWLTANQAADFLGLFARENVVVGDFTNSTWRQYVRGWLASSMNSSQEDAGADQIPNSRNGADGIAGTADDDLLEDDGVFTTEVYTASDAALGLIPSGFSIGDRIPGTGEDIDGDGEWDDTITLSDFDMGDPLDPAYWEGNIPPGGVATYSDIASMYANHLDASFYTNHAFSWVMFGSDPAELNGSMVTRNENIVYGTPSLNFNYDARLLGGTTGLAGDLLPHVLRPLEVLQWRRIEEDPFRVMP